MTYTQRRLLNFLLSAVAVLIALLVAVTLWKRRAQDQQEEDPAASSSAVIPAAQASGGEGGCTALTYYNGLATLSFARDQEAGWYWADDRSFPLDGSFVERIVNLAAGLRPQQTISPADALEDYGLDKPAMHLTASFGEESSSTMYIGNQVAGGSGSYYMYLEGKPETVYVIASTLPAALEKGIYDMMELPDLPALEEESIQSVSVTGPSAPAAEEGGTPLPGRVTILNSYAGTDGVSWRSGGVSVADNETVQGLLALLTGVKLSRCVDYKPSDDAVSLCGFDNPAAAAVVRYRDGGDQEQTFRLTVGAAADGTERYVRVDDDATIYAVSAASLAPLLTVAESGLT